MSKEVDESTNIKRQDQSDLRNCKFSFTQVPAIALPAIALPNWRTMLPISCITLRKS